MKNKNISTYAIIGLQYGDEGKGKVTHELLERLNPTHGLRFNGGANAGHTIVHKGETFITHLLPATVFRPNTRSIIGPGCVLNIPSFFKEIEELEAKGIKVKDKIFVAYNTHIVTEEHLAEEAAMTNDTIGTTRRGIGPACRDKHARTGKRAEEFPELSPYLVDTLQEFDPDKPAVIFAEGAQAFGLDIDWGHYPLVTSTVCGVGGIIQNGVPLDSLEEIWGVAKAYETYVGARKFQPDEAIFNDIAELGKEYGATTKRKRQCNWTDLHLLRRAIQLNGVRHIVINKMDILRQLNTWKLRNTNSGEIINFNNEEDFKEFLISFLKELNINEKNIHFSERADQI